MMTGLIVTAAKDLVQQDGAEVVILVGAVMAAMPSRAQSEVPVPVIEGLSCAVVLAEALARLRFPKLRTGSFAPLPACEQVGLGPALASRFGWGEPKELGRCHILLAAG